MTTKQRFVPAVAKHDVRCSVPNCSIIAGSGQMFYWDNANKIGKAGRKTCQNCRNVLAASEGETFEEEAGQSTSPTIGKSFGAAPDPAILERLDAIEAQARNHTNNLAQLGKWLVNHCKLIEADEEIPEALFAE